MEGDDFTPLGQEILAYYGRREFDEAEPLVAGLIKRSSDTSELLRLVQRSRLARMGYPTATCSNEDDLGEVENETLMAIHKAVLKDADSLSPFHPWVRSVAKNKAIDLQRRSSRQGRNDKAAMDNDLQALNTATRLSSLIATEADLERAKEQLDPTLHQVFVAWELHEPNVSQAARSIRMTRKRYLSRLRKAKIQVAAIVGRLNSGSRDGNPGV